MPFPFFCCSSKEAEGTPDEQALKKTEKELANLRKGFAKKVNSRDGLVEGGLIPVSKEQIAEHQAQIEAEREKEIKDKENKIEELKKQIETAKSNSNAATPTP